MANTVGDSTSPLAFEDKQVFKVWGQGAEATQASISQCDAVWSRSLNPQAVPPWTAS